MKSFAPQLLLIGMAVTTLVGCGGGGAQEASHGVQGASHALHELQNAQQAKRFIVDVAKGRSPDSWELADNAAAKADHAWADRNAIARLGSALRQHGTEWGCKAAKRVHQAHELLSDAGQRMSITERTGLKAEAELRGGASASEAEMLIKQAESLTDSELVAVTAKLCEASEQLG
jgi:hypothetical protein